MLPKIDYTVLKDAATSLGYAELPPLGEVTEELKMNEEFQRKVHRALLDIHVIDGQLVCPETGRPGFGLAPGSSGHMGGLEHSVSCGKACGKCF